jgi:16S rRNA (cytosine967-C5)-methyltransferase
VERWLREYGSAATRKICEHDQAVPATAIRVRDAGAEAELAREGVVLAGGALLNSARCVVEGDVTKTAAFGSGRVVIQDEASQLVAALAGKSEEKTRILDCCAAPGGKTLAIADRNPQAEITAVELHAHRGRLLEKLLRDQGTRIQIVIADARELPVGERFDRVLTDVPCSGTGTLGRNPEIKWRLKPGDLADLRARQVAILRSALRQLAPVGRLIYSTCSLEKEENEDVIEAALEGNVGFQVLDCGAELDRLRSSGELVWADLASLTRGDYLRTIPGVHPCDGFFAAMVERK